MIAFHASSSLVNFVASAGALSAFAELLAPNVAIETTISPTDRIWSFRTSAHLSHDVAQLRRGPERPDPVCGRDGCLDCHVGRKQLRESTQDPRRSHEVDQTCWMRGRRSRRNLSSRALLKSTMRSPKSNRVLRPWRTPKKRKPRKITFGWPLRSLRFSIPRVSRASLLPTLTLLVIKSMHCSLKFEKHNFVCI